MSEKEWNNRIQIYPNPSCDQVTIQLLNSEASSTLKIYNLSGTLIYENLTFSGQKTLPIKDLPSGVYIVKVATEKAEIYVQKLIRI